MPPELAQSRGREGGTCEDQDAESAGEGMSSLERSRAAGGVVDGRCAGEGSAGEWVTEVGWFGRERAWCGRGLRGRGDNGQRGGGRVDDAVAGGEELA